MGFLSLMGWQRWVVYGALAAASIAVLVGYGYHLGIRKLWEYQAEQARAAVPVVVRQGAVTERVVTEYRERVVRVKATAEVIEKEVVRYVPTTVDCMLPRGWVQLHDAAAAGALPPPAGGADAAAPGLRASRALQGVAGNYEACLANAEQLSALQRWVREQYLNMNNEPLGY